LTLPPPTAATEMQPNFSVLLLWPGTLHPGPFFCQVVL
jgi:hypothetical protein